MMVRLLASVGVVLLAACSSPSQPPGDTAPAPPEEGDSAPRFELPASDGTRISLDHFSSKPVLLYFSMGPG
jgi:cytochrome oxidase Cu insertion factor (SCO1/SenC/PrrC family)